MNYYYLFPTFYTQRKKRKKKIEESTGRIFPKKEFIKLITTNFSVLVSISRET
jgi:hypothetical protein